MLRAEAHAVAVAIRVALRMLPFARVVALLARLPREYGRSAGTDACLAASVEASGRAAHPTCLFTALTAFALLARRGYGPRLVIGAARERGFDAHAWVTVDGAAVLPCDREYVPLWSCGAPSAGTR
jgi:hypothetical protein